MGALCTLRNVFSSRVNNKEKIGAKFNAYLLPDAYNPAVNLRCIFPYICPDIILIIQKYGKIPIDNWLCSSRCVVFLKFSLITWGKTWQESDFRRHSCFQNPLLFLGIGRPQASLVQRLQKQTWIKLNMHVPVQCGKIDDLVYMGDCRPDTQDSRLSLKFCYVGRIQQHVWPQWVSCGI